ncbi:predicted protein [Histoplasma capsulatum var. duboisii H88]|uniref:Predicted protein n=1 Tax=Ajellomyces capsulatus (strain H88) TaxID=544711 RepID=F0UK60_AJEC8|nr:predicted protein [Histoplasma capsulatum var. duboisii H88]
MYPFLKILFPRRWNWDILPCPNGKRHEGAHRIDFVENEEKVQVMATGKNNQQVVTGPTLAASMPQGDIGGMEIRRGEKRPAYNDRKVMKVNVRSRSLGVENESFEIRLGKGYQPRATVEHRP